MLCLSLLPLIFSLQQDWRTREAEQEGEVAQTTYTHVNKCKYDKIENKNKATSLRKSKDI
jgi:hypothetical protein